MKKQFKLEEYFFQKVEFSVPPFNRETSKMKIYSAKAKYDIYYHKRQKDKVALEWTFSNRGRRKGAKKREFMITVQVVGIFSGVKGITDRERDDYVMEHGLPLLYTVARREVGRLLRHTLLTPPELPAIEP